MSKHPEALFTQMNLSKGKSDLKPAKVIPPQLARKIDFNQSLLEKYGFFSTPAIVWKNKQGELKSTQGLPQNIKEIFEQ